MDWLNVCYTSAARLVAGSDETFTIRWYPAAPGAKTFPGEHAFGSHVWIDPHNGPWEGPGEIDQVRSKVKGINPGFTGQCVPDNPEWFLAGMPPSVLAGPDPARVCCRRTVSPIGGPLCGGTAYFAIREKGQLVLDGSYTLSPAPLAFTGKLVLDGMAQGPVFPGTLVLDGSYRMSDSTTAFTGTLVLDGSYRMSDSTTAFTGTLVLDGYREGPDFTGTLVLDGTTPVGDLRGDLVLDGEVS
jgi:hypothetical protein